MPWRSAHKVRVLGMEKQNLIRPGAKRRLQHMLEAAPDEGARSAIRTSYGLVKVTNSPFYTHPEGSGVPVLNDAAKRAITGGTERYYREEVIRDHGDNLLHLRDVLKHLNIEVTNREYRLKAIGQEKAKPDSPKIKLNHMVSTHLNAELDVLQRIRGEVEKKALALEASKGTGAQNK